MNYFSYSDAQLEELKQKDERLKELIEKTGRIERELSPDLYTGLVQSIISQQISSAASATICGRLERRISAISPENISGLGADGLSSVGVSSRKISYILRITDEITSGKFRLDECKGMTDEEVTAALVSLPGVGVWTAEMLMIFSMNRMNILSTKDLGIRRGLRALYGIEELDEAMIEKIKMQFSPYCSIASFYLWTVT